MQYICLTNLQTNLVAKVHLLISIIMVAILIFTIYYSRCALSLSSKHQGMPLHNFHAGHGPSPLPRPHKITTVSIHTRGTFWKPVHVAIKCPYETFDHDINMEIPFTFLVNELSLSYKFNLRPVSLSLHHIKSSFHLLRHTCMFGKNNAYQNR